MTARQLGNFLRSPSLTGVASSVTPFREAIWLFIILIGSMTLVGIFLLPFVIAGNVQPSEGLGSVMATSPYRLILAVVVVGPLIEEIAFRSWLTGTLNHILAASVFVATLWGGRLLMSDAVNGGSTAVGWALIALGLGGYVASCIVVRNAKRFTWFETGFPIIFWLHALIFGTLHLGNYDGELGAALLVFTIPQVVAGLVFGYARLRIGLLAAIGLHAAFNAGPVAAVLLARSF